MKNSNITIPELIFRNKFFIIFKKKEIKMLVNIIIMKLIINLISWYYYSCST